MSTPSNPTTTSYPSSSYRPSLPTTPSTNYAQALASSPSAPSVSPNTLSDGRKIPDGRKETGAENPRDTTKGVVGDGVLPSGASAWKPAYVRMQSWNEQDMKREYTMSSLEK